MPGKCQSLQGRFCSLCSSKEQTLRPRYIQRKATGACSEEWKFSLPSSDPSFKARAVSVLLSFNLGNSCVKDKEHQSRSGVLHSSHPPSHRKHQRKAMEVTVRSERWDELCHLELPRADISHNYWFQEPKWNLPQLILLHELCLLPVTTRAPQTGYLCPAFSQTWLFNSFLCLIDKPRASMNPARAPLTCHSKSAFPKE